MRPFAAPLRSRPGQSRYYARIQFSKSGRLRGDRLRGRHAVWSAFSCQGAMDTIYRGGTLGAKSRWRTRRIPSLEPKNTRRFSRALGLKDRCLVGRRCTGQSGYTYNASRSPTFGHQKHLATEQVIQSRAGHAGTCRRSTE
jgi:hypothetical protein